MRFNNNRARWVSNVRWLCAGGLMQCQICGTTEELTLDHIIPSSKGGDDTRENAAILCRYCNNHWKADRIIHLEPFRYPEKVIRKVPEVQVGDISIQGKILDINKWLKEEKIIYIFIVDLSDAFLVNKKGKDRFVLTEKDSMIVL